MIINIINQTKYRLPSKKIFQALLQKTFQTAVCPLSAPHEINLIFLSRGRMKKINAQFAGLNYAANVLAFDYTTNFKKLYFEKTKPLAEILICPCVAKSEAQQLDISVAERVKLLFVHGLLHILGYKHNTERKRVEMEKIEDKIMEN